MRSVLTLTLVVLAPSVAAHPGHIVDVAGHDHWVAGVAVGAAILIGLWGALKPKKDAEAEPDSEFEEEPVA